MDSFTILFFFILGAIIGSFLNVVIYRYNTGQSVRGRSACMSCVRRLAWYEMIPVVSFTALRGKCRTCLTKIAWQYPAVEFAAALMFALVGATDYSIATKLYGCLSFSFLMVISVYDIRHTIIPDGPVFAFVFMGFLRLFLSGALNIVDLYTGFLCGLFFAGLWYVSSGRWMGFGDAKLALGIGWFLPYPYNITAIIFAFWLGAAGGIAMLGAPKLASVFSSAFGARRSRATPGLSTEIPFAPFLALGTLFVFLVPISLW